MPDIWASKSLVPIVHICAPNKVVNAHEARICKLLTSPEINSKEPIPPAEAAGEIDSLELIPGLL